MVGARQAGRQAGARVDGRAGGQAGRQAHRAGTQSNEHCMRAAWRGVAPGTRRGPGCRWTRPLWQTASPRCMLSHRSPVPWPQRRLQWVAGRLEAGWRPGWRQVGGRLEAGFRWGTEPEGDMCDMGAIPYFRDGASHQGSAASCAECCNAQGAQGMHACRHACRLHQAAARRRPPAHEPKVKVLGMAAWRARKECRSPLLVRYAGQLPWVLSLAPRGPWGPRLAALHGSSVLFACCPLTCARGGSKQGHRDCSLP